MQSPVSCYSFFGSANSNISYLSICLSVSIYLCVCLFFVSVCFLVYVFFSLWSVQVFVKKYFLIILLATHLNCFFCEYKN